MATVEVEVGVEIMNHFQASYFERSKGSTVGQQFGFERAPTGFGLGVVVGVARPAEAGQGPGLGDAGAAGSAGVLAAAVGVDDEPRRGLTQGQGLLQGQQHEFGGHLRGQVPTHDPPGTGIAPSGQVAPAPAYQRQVRDVAHPHLVRGNGRRLAEQPVFRDDGRRVGHGGAGPLRAGAQGPQALAVQPGAQGVAAHCVAFGPQFGPQSPGAVAAGMARKRLLGSSVPGCLDGDGPPPPLVIAGRAHGQQAAEHLHRPRLRTALNKRVTAHD